ncbi:cilia- and flagella-associated protein 70 [Hypomesus transpacificus]|uniref:cilia- and flagella-associated protein 70 n=1 Tax=Hypomesus transpacificus TaxID=137520 RepID=UPI001F083DD1|nr:cilia- and flagella-associated protein 70 [Hypomesus transpacificus]
MEPFREKAVPVQITVSRGNNLKGNKPNESFLNFVRAEFNGQVLGDSQKLDASVDLGVNYNFTCSFECSDAADTLDDVAHKPVILTVIEILPKEKKEKTAVVGQAVVDLLPLLHGQCSLSSTVLLHPTPGSSAEAAYQEGSSKVQASLDVIICVPEPLLSVVQLSESNLLKVTVETAYSIPEVWNTALGSDYVAALQIPLTAEKEETLWFSNGLLKVGGERETVGRPRKWPLGPLLAPGAQFIPASSIEGDPIELEDGDLTSIEDRDFRIDAETNKKRVSWDTERRCFLDTGGAVCLTRRIGKSRLWPVEVMRSMQAGAPKGGKPGKPATQAEDESQISFHGVAYVDMAPLLYPGARRIRGAYRLYPFYDSELLAKAKRNVSVLKESTRAPATQGRGRAPSSMGSCKAAPSKTFDSLKGGKDTKESPKKPGATVKPITAESVTEVEPQVNVEGQMYADSRTYIIIEIALEKPLVPKRPPEELAQRVKELLPPRPPLSRRPAGAERAIQGYHSQIASVAGQVLEQYKQLFGPAFLPGGEPLDPNAQEERKTQLLGELNYSGKFFAFKEQMKYSVVKIVREKMLRTEAFTDPEHLQAFLSSLHVFLVDEMHVALNKTLSVDAQESQPRPLLDCAQLRHFAREAQLSGDYQLASQYYQEQLTRERNNPSHWFDYGAFYMLSADYLKAEECFHYAVSIEQAHLRSLMMCGVLAEMGERHEEAEIFFERATCVDPTSVAAWTLFGLFYLSQDNPIQAEMAFLEASKQQCACLVVTPPCRPDTGEAGPVGEEEPEQAVPESSRTNRTDGERDGGSGSGVTGSQSSQGNRSGEDFNGGVDPDLATARLVTTPTRLNSTIYMETVQFLLQNNTLQMAQRALAQELLCPDGGLSSSYHLAMARLQLQRAEYGSAQLSLQEALKDSFQDPDVWALYGHLHYQTGEHRKAQECYERTLDFVVDASDTHPIYLRLGSIYLEEAKYEMAKRTYLRACMSTPSCLTWLGLGIACYRLGELTEAEDALTEANILNNGNSEVWGYLALVCLQTGRRPEAEQSYKYAVKLKLQKEYVLQEIKELQARVGFGNPSF